MLETFINWFSVGIGLAIGILSAVVGISLLIILGAIIYVVIANYYYDKNHKDRQ